MTLLRGENAKERVSMLDCRWKQLNSAVVTNLYIKKNCMKEYCEFFFNKFHKKKKSRLTFMFFSHVCRTASLDIQCVQSYLCNMQTNIHITMKWRELLISPAGNIRYQTEHTEPHLSSLFSSLMKMGEQAEVKHTARAQSSGHAGFSLWFLFLTLLNRFLPPFLSLFLFSRVS